MRLNIRKSLEKKFVVFIRNKKLQIIYLYDILKVLLNLNHVNNVSI